jgi:hypothetical protein
MHVRVIHRKLDPRTHKCSRCDYSPGQKVNLDKHIKSVHEPREFLCAHCDLDFVTHTDLMSHIRSVHHLIRNISSSVNTVKCAQCDYTAGTKLDLLTHVSLVHVRAQVQKPLAIQEVLKGTNQIDSRDNQEEKIHLTRPVYDKMRGNKKEAKVGRDCQDPTEHIKKKPNKTDLIHNDIAGKELDASLTELNHGDEIDFHKLSAEEMPVLTPKLELPCDVSPKIVNIPFMDGNSLRIIDGRGGFKEPSAITEDVIKQEFEKCQELENVEMKTEQIDIKNEFVCDD